MSEKVVVYYTDQPESQYIVAALNRDSFFRQNVEFRELPLDQVVIKGLSITHPLEEEFPEYCGLIWGTGFWHHLSLLITPKMDFYKAAFDAHTDFCLSAAREQRIVDCTNHASALLLQNKNIQLIETIFGTQLVAVATRDPSCTEGISEEAHIGRGSIVGLARSTLQISVDLDVIKNFPASAGLNRGDLTLSELDASIEQICQKHNVIGFDIGGLDLSVLDRIRTEENNSVFRDAERLSVKCYGQCLGRWVYETLMRRKVIELHQLSQGNGPGSILYLEKSAIERWAKEPEYTPTLRVLSLGAYADMLIRRGDAKLPLGRNPQECEFFLWDTGDKTTIPIRTAITQNRLYETRRSENKQLGFPQRPFFVMRGNQLTRYE
ncbi:hypothetical protein JW930_00720 [Candidatus Woesearchaeota archaeon]|nr:hypothetical protein [Candidatus Woesearchaeota archaeon]